MPIGIALPFAQATGSIGYFEITEEERAAISSNILSILVTNWGERLNHYTFGCNFREFFFEPITRDELRSRIADRIISQINTWMPFVVISNLNIFLEEDSPRVPENGIGIDIAFTLKNKPDVNGSDSFLISVG